MLTAVKVPKAVSNGVRSVRRSFPRLVARDVALKLVSRDMTAAYAPVASPNMIVVTQNNARIKCEFPDFASTRFVPGFVNF